jgi:hypothetical protein
VPAWVQFWQRSSCYTQSQHGTDKHVKPTSRQRERERENSIPQFLPRAYPPLSRTTGACPRNLTEGDRRCQKRQQIEDQTCIKLGPGRLGALMETHQHPPPPVSLLYTVATQGREAFLGGGVVTPWSLGTGGTCDSFSPNINIKEKNSCTVSCPLLQLRLCQSMCANYWA